MTTMRDMMRWLLGGKRTARQDLEEGAYVSRSQGQLVWRAFKRHRVGQAGAAVVIMLVLVAVFANFLAPYHYGLQMRGRPFHPPSRIRIIDQEGRLTWPFVYATNRVVDRATFRVSYVEDTTMAYPIRLFVRGPDTHRILGLFPTNLRLFGVGTAGNDPRDVAQIFLLGSDSLARCLFSRILYGSRISLIIGPLVVLIIMPIAVILGGVSGYYGGGIDEVIQRACEVVIAVPGLPILLVAATIMHALGIPPGLAFLGIVGILAMISWGGLTRILRGMFLSLREREYVLAAKAIGCSDLRIILRHMTPGVLTYLLVGATLSMPGMILTESALSFLGLGIREPATSWGMLVQEAANIVNIEMHPWILIPGVVIFVTVLAFNFMGDALRDATDPHSNR